jgi:hypothetical protein
LKRANCSAQVRRNRYLCELVAYAVALNDMTRPKANHVSSRMVEDGDVASPRSAAANAGFDFRDLDILLWERKPARKSVNAYGGGCKPHIKSEPSRSVVYDDLLKKGRRKGKSQETSPSAWHYDAFT